MCGQCKSLVEDQAQFCPHCGSAIVAASVNAHSAPPQRLGEGSQVDLGWGRVAVTSRLGEGGMGVVHKGWLYYNPEGERATEPPHPVAIKALHPMLRGRDRARRLFLSEATLLSRLSHPNIVHFFGLAEGDQLAIVMELVDGSALNEVIARHVQRAVPGGLPAMPFARAWHYFSQLLGALAAIHALGIIHRDVKPANVLVRRDGVVKLTDFGIARVPAEEAKNTGGMAPGTGAYMSPEQVLGRDIDARSDLYSAAIVLYEMLVGVTPFDRPERNEVMVRTAQVQETAKPISQLIPQAPRILDALMAQALAKDRANRYESAIAMGEAFRKALDLPESAGWSAQQEFAAHAQVISMAVPQQGSGVPTTDPGLPAQVAPPSAPAVPAPPAPAPAQPHSPVRPEPHRPRVTTRTQPIERFDAGRLRTAMMTAYKKP